MKFTLQITDASKEEILAFLAGTTSIVSPITGNVTGAMIASGSITAPAGQAMPSVTSAGDDDGPVNTNAPAIDTTGMPWDDRIHSKNRNTNADGTWRAKRNVDPALKAGVEAELKSRTVQQFTPPVIPPAMPPNSAPMQFTPPPGMPHEQPSYQPPMPQQQFQPQPPMQYQPAPQQPAPMDFGGFMQHLTGQMNKKDGNGFPLITVEYLASVCQRITAQTGVQTNSITDIATNPTAINLAVMFINGDGRWQ